MLSLLCVRLTIKVKVEIPESFKVGWYPPKKTGSSHLKLLCGYKWEQLPLCDGEDPFAVTASFQNPYEDQTRDKRLFVVVCPSHQVS